MKKSYFVYVDSFFYYFMKAAMVLLKYAIIFIILFIAGLVFLHAMNPLGVENFLGSTNRDIPAWRAWNAFKNIFNIIGGISFLIVFIFSIIHTVKEKLYLERKKFIRYSIVFFLVGPIILLPIVLLKENFDTKYRRYRLALYLYSMLIFIQASRFIGGALGDILTICAYTIVEQK